MESLLTMPEEKQRFDYIIANICNTVFILHKYNDVPLFDAFLCFYGSEYYKLTSNLKYKDYLWPPYVIYWRTAMDNNLTPTEPQEYYYNPDYNEYEKFALAIEKEKKEKNITAIAAAYNFRFLLAE